MRSAIAKYAPLTALLLALLLSNSSNVHAALPSQDANATLRIVNESEQTICQVFISPVTADSWGDNWLGEDETIPRGATASFDLTVGDYDILLADCKGNRLLDERDAFISALYELSFTGPNLCEALSQEAEASYLQAQYDNALQKSQDALACYRESGDRANEGRTLANIGAIYYSVGQYGETLDYYEEALSILEEMGDRAGEGITLNNIGMVHHSLGQYGEALDYYGQALGIRREIGHRRGEGITLNNIGAVYHSLGQYEQALKYFEEALSIRRETNDRAGEGDTLNNIGMVYDSLGQYEEALDYYQKALSILQEISNRAGEGAALNNIGGVYDSLGQHGEALSYYEKALGIAQEIGDRTGEARTLNNIGFTYSLLGQDDEALDHLEQALSIAQEMGHQSGEARTLNNIGEVYHSQGQNDEALSYYEQAIAVIETMRGGMRVEEFKTSFAAENVDVYRRTISLLVEMARPAEAFGYVQRAKARAFLDQMGNARIAPRATGDADLLAQEQALSGEIRALEDALAGRSHISPPSPEQRSELQARLEAAYREYERLLVQIKRANPQYASLRTVQASTLITVRQTLPPDITLLEYYVTNDETYAFVIKQEGFHAEVISVTRESLYQGIDGFRLEAAATLEGVPASLQRLYDVLIAPVADRLETAQLLIAPHDVLHYVPFAALYDGERYLIAQYTLAQIPSASVLPFVLGEGEESRAPPLVLGDPDGSLPHSRQEARSVAELYGTAAYTGDEAQERLVWERGPEAGILHLATHGAYNEEAPLFSRILLTADTEEEFDGVLEVHEVYNLDLSNADLVVLSACQTHLGERSAGDEIVGLNRAFIYAGAPSVVTSLWNVDDAATGELMVAFYRYLREGQSKGEALRHAQMDLIRNPDTSHPYYWAGFVLTGDAGGPDPSATSKAHPPSDKGDSGGGLCFGSAPALLLVATIGALAAVRKSRG